MKRILQLLLVLILTVSMIGIGAGSSVNTVRAVDDDDKLTVIINNILNTSHTQVNGHAVAYETSLKMVPGQGKLINSSGVYSMVDGKNKTANGLGYTYKFLNVFVKSSAEGTVVTAEAADEYVTLKKISHAGEGRVVLTYIDDTTEELDDTYTVYISPVYSATASWYLNYHYVDNISNASSAWSNADFVTTYKHTFKNPGAVQKKTGAEPVI
ncbi:MAG: hypothetical protein K6A14_06510 [Erysipelotrichaceae bacterium]|nr:hypothetical protein [Erysipelotrichaceae bacterium]